MRVTLSSLVFVTIFGLFWSCQAVAQSPNCRANLGYNSEGFVQDAAYCSVGDIETVQFRHQRICELYNDRQCMVHLGRSPNIISLDMNSLRDVQRYCSQLSIAWRNSGLTVSDARAVVVVYEFEWPDRRIGACGRNDFGPWRVAICNWRGIFRRCEWEPLN